MINKKFREPYVQSWNLAVQRALPFNFSLDVAYVANHGVAQPANFNLNAATVLGLDVQGQPVVPKLQPPIDHQPSLPGLQLEL